MSPMGDYDVLESECKGNHLYDYINNNNVNVF
nr:MAG TPA: hypothetical protein [Caudoviricetes sp.]DAW39452.1 MAG TPA: hypothetical protein [Bacteriophage sp.]